MSDLPETTQLVTFALHLAFVTAAAREDGFSLADVGKYLPLLKEIGPALRGSDQIPKELSHLDSNAVLELVGVVQELTGAQIKGGHAMRVTNAALALARDLVILVETIENADATMPSTPKVLAAEDAAALEGGETEVAGVLVEVRRAVAVEEPTPNEPPAPRVEAVVAGVEITKKTVATAVILPPGAVPPVVAYTAPGGGLADPLPKPVLREKTAEEKKRAELLGNGTLEG